MQPESPYRFTHALGGSPVGKAWAAIDNQGRFVTVAVLDATVAAVPGWREAFAAIANSLAQSPDGLAYTYADFAADAPWAAYPSEAGPGAEKLFRALGVEYTPVPAVAPPTSAPPVSGPPQPQSGPSSSVSPAALPTSGMPYAARAAQSMPTPEQPLLAATQPGLVAPMSPATRHASMPPVPHQADASLSASPSPQPGHDPFTATGRRIAPVQPARKRRGWIPITVGALTLTLIAGTAGFVLGKGSEGDPVVAPSSASAPLPPYEASQLAINKARFEGPLAPLAQPWLSRIGGCVTFDEAGAPKLPADEKGHVVCRYGGAWLHFTLYPGKKQKDTARTYRLQLNISNADLAPGIAGEVTRTTGEVTRAAGSYLEYAYKGEDGRSMCGIWWERDDVDAAWFLETYCEDGIGGNWDALRDLWKRGS
ncbi:hypothetical protein ACTMSW_02775 [Micromonospora sp. BQ11]|uniref:hypothetical protein n=1 Tax=Micromonospora sp. BQ11 TaxID=3452212 RepID=UPI003F8AE0B5